MDREIAERLERLEDKLDKILIQTTATNGKVISLQEWRKDVSKDIENLKENRSSNKGRDNLINDIVKAVAAVALAVFVYWLGTKK